MNGGRATFLRMHFLRSCLAVALVSAASPPAMAELAEPTLAARPALEWTLTAIAGVVWFTEAVFVKPEIAPLDCRWCASNGFDDALRGLRHSNPRTADVTSDVISYAVAPLAAGGLLAAAAAHDGEPRDLVVDLLMVAQAGVATGLIGDVVRWGTGRERPSVHALPEAEKATTDRPEENNLSFFSGHVAIAFALAVSSGTVASIRRRRLAPAIWATGLTVAAATSYLRVAADEHYATDVLVGIAVGAGIGLAVPLLHRRCGSGATTVAPSPVPGGALLTLTILR